MISSAGYASLLRLELRERNRKFQHRYNLAAQYSYGSSPVVVYEPEIDRHGNFHSVSYQHILANDNWRKRLSKVHTSARAALPKSDRKWCELDSCNSSDALLMNVFCHPGIMEDSRLAWLLGLETMTAPEFGVRARVPLLEGRRDRTEVDMRIGDLLVESKLTEADFQSKTKATLETYRDFREVFNRRDLPQTREKYSGYQLIRNVLAAYAMEMSFCVICDARRPDLIEQWYAVMRCVKIADLRVRCKVLTWQELSEALPDDLQRFLDEKYGICPGPLAAYEFDHLRD
jgi:hypothetical protein